MKAPNHQTVRSNKNINDQEINIPYSVVQELIRFQVVEE